LSNYERGKGKGREGKEGSHIYCVLFSSGEESGRRRYHGGKDVKKRGEKKKKRKKDTTDRRPQSLRSLLLLQKRGQTHIGAKMITIRGRGEKKKRENKNGLSACPPLFFLTSGREDLEGH